MKTFLFKATNPKDRIATSRLDLSLFPDTAVAYGALGMTEGDCKYGGYNYRVGGVLASVYVAALRRHVAKWYNGENEDSTTGVSHLASAIACVGIIIDACEVGVLNDDRPPKVDMNRLLNEFEGKVKHLQQLFPPGPGRFTELTTKLIATKPTAKKKVRKGDSLRSPRSRVSGNRTTKKQKKGK